MQMDAVVEVRGAEAALARVQVPVRLRWEGLSFAVEIHDPEGKDAPSKKVVLDGLSAECGPGQLLAVMGASGSGKTALLNCLAQRQSDGVSGRVSFNGQGFRRELQKYMHQCYHIWTHKPRFSSPC